MNDIATVTRGDVTSFTQPLLIIFVLAILLFIVSLISFNVLFKKKRKARENTKTLSYIYLETMIVCQAAIFLTGPTLFVLLIFLSTMDVALFVNEYIVFIGLVYLFSAILSIVFLGIVSNSFFKKQLKRKRMAKRVPFSAYLLSASGIHLVSFLLAYFLFPRSFNLLALLFIICSLIIHLIGLLLQALSYQSKEKKRKAKKSRRKKNKRKKD